jgi:hypothetical protein
MDTKAGLLIVSLVTPSPVIRGNTPPTPFKAGNIIQSMPYAKHTFTPSPVNIGKLPQRP